MVLLPKGSPYASPEDEVNAYPKYKPLPNYPGQCSPGTLAENAPYQTLPETSPVPEPHLQEQDWHGACPSPHPAPQAIVDFVDGLGLWISQEEFEKTESRQQRKLSTARSEVMDDMDFEDDTLDEVDINDGSSGGGSDNDDDSDAFDDLDLEDLIE